MILHRTKVQFTGNPVKTDPMIKQIGAYVPLSVFSSITLYTLAKNWNKSSLISTILAKWMRENFTPKDENECIQIVAKNIHDYYGELKINRKSTMSYEQFITLSIKELEIKGLTMTVIKAILIEIDILHEKK